MKEIRKLETFIKPNYRKRWKKFGPKERLIYDENDYLGEIVVTFEELENFEEYLNLDWIPCIDIDERKVTIYNRRDKIRVSANNKKLKKMGGIDIMFRFRPVVNPTDNYLKYNMSKKDYKEYLKECGKNV